MKTSLFVYIGFMLFPSVELASRIEQADCRLVRNCAEAVRSRDDAADVIIITVAGGVATFTGPGSPMNKVAGLGFGGAVDADELTSIEQAFHERGVPVQVELSSLADPAIGAMLTERGYILRGFENILGCSLPVPQRPAPPNGIDIAVDQAEDMGPWLDVLVSAFMSPDEKGVESHESFDPKVLRSVMADMSSSQGIVRYLASRDGTLAGGASMCISGDIAQMCGAGTLPEHRRQGIQKALLAMRLADAGAAGCEVAIVTTLPGSQSQENVRRQGFELLYVRAMLLLEP